MLDITSHVAKLLHKGGQVNITADRVVVLFNPFTATKLTPRQLIFAKNYNSQLPSSAPSPSWAHPGPGWKFEFSQQAVCSDKWPLVEEGGASGKDSECIFVPEGLLHAAVIRDWYVGWTLTVGSSSGPLRVPKFPIKGPSVLNFTWDEAVRDHVCLLDQTENNACFSNDLGNLEYATYKCGDDHKDGDKNGDDKKDGNQRRALVFDY
ncbi:hypothetical protein F4778DRAFT_785189 [Xylariomycetidae sp. FL2044]|nr:hypothetical protein F4778DRAFT_785189 [Xylariomycetidae sp. FL2044]